VWTICLISPRVREWGFWCRTGWKPWGDYVIKRDGGNEAGLGC
jgi:hypothetical protein